MTNHDWPLQAQITGSGFHGPKSILAKSYQTTKYPLVFRPQNENPVAVSLPLVCLFFTFLQLLFIAELVKGASND